MAIAMIMRWKGVTPEQYDDLRRTVDWEGDQPAGGIFHIAAFDDDGLRITDVWDTAEDFQRFVDERLMPAVREHGGLQTEPEIEILPAYAIHASDLVQSVG